MFGRMVRVEYRGHGDAARLILTTLTRRVQRTRRRDRRFTHNTREDIVAKILHTRLKGDLVTGQPQDVET